MTEYSLAPIMLTFLLGLSKFFIVFLSLYIPTYLLVRALSIRNLVR